MTISRDRFSLALERLKPSDWEHFEALASAFLAAEFGTLRTLATPSGDGGRDAIIFCPDNEPETVFQYSVTDRWNAKIRETIARLGQTEPQLRTFVYVSNRTIGAQADGLKKELRTKGRALDVRDSSFFLERVDADTARSNAAQELARRIVDPLLEDRGILSEQGAMSGREANTALLFVEMQREDEAANKGLTRSCFEALVKSTLRTSTREEPVSRSEVHRRVQALLPQHAPSTLSSFIDSALHRLKRQAISQWAGDPEDKFHLSYAESERLKDASARLISMREAFDRDVYEILDNASSVVLNDKQSITTAVHQIVQLYFLRRGEEFAASVVLDEDPPVHEDDLKSIIREHFPSKAVKGRDGQAFGLTVVTTLLAAPSDRTRAYLRLLSDSYTLMSFLSATPDVQAATRKLFNQGRIWLDTGAVLPVLAETVASEDERPFTVMFRQARRCGARLHITWGVIEEIERHLNLCRAYSSTSGWVGYVPYVYARYLFGGGKKDSFRAWLEQFIGSLNPLQDLADYLSDEHGFITGEDTDTTNVPVALREGLSDYWRQIHEGRRNVEGQAYNINIDALTRHDVENCLNVLADRSRNRKVTKLGQQSWWLTLDRAAVRMPKTLPPEIQAAIHHPLVISLDFLMRYIAFGPNREMASREDRSNARIFAQPLMEVVPQELVRVAVNIRESSAALPERLVRRRLRDALDLERARIGPFHDAGLEGAADALMGAY
jgi:hypothetical protein